MYISQDFKNALESKDLIAIRIMIKDSFVIDPTFRELNAYIKYAEENLSDLYEEHDNEEFKNNPLEWDKDYMNEQLNNLMYNFSRERINHLKKVCSNIYAERIENIERKRREENKKIEITKKNVAIGAIAAGTVGAVGGIVLGKTIIAVGGVVVVTAGAISYFNEINK